MEDVRKAFGDDEVLHGVDLTVHRGDRLAILGPNGIGKSTLLKVVMGELEPDGGEVEWGYEAHPGYFAQDHHEQIGEGTLTAEEWLRGACPGETRGTVRAHMGLMLFEGDEGRKPLSALSGGEAARLVFSRLLLERPNVLVLDEPTNHLDLEAIEALVEGLEAFEGTLVLVSHDRWFVSRLATRIVEIRPGEILDYRGGYEAYVHACGDDHLDADAVVTRARKAKRESRKEGVRENGGRRKEKGGQREGEKRRRVLKARTEELESRIQGAEDRISAIEAVFAEPGYFRKSDPDEVAELERERMARREEVARLMEEWEALERELQEVEEG